MEQPANSYPQISTRRIAIWTATVLSVAALMTGVYALRDLILLFFVGVVVAASLRPFTLYLQRYRIPKAWAVILIYVGFLALALTGAFLVLPSLVTEATTFVDQAPTRYQEVLTTLQQSDSYPLRRLGWALPAAQDLTPFVSARFDSDSLVNFANAMISLSTALITVLAVAFYWTMDQPRMERLWLSLAPSTERPRLLAAWRDVETAMGAYLRGTVILGVVVAIVTGVGYAVMGLRYALILAVLAGLGEFVPVVGFLVGLVPALLIGLTVSPQLALLVLVWNLVVQGLENAILVPRVMSQAVGVSPLVVIFALLAFGSLFGVVGAFLAIPLAAVIQVMLDHWILRRDENREALPHGTAAAQPLAVAHNHLEELRDRLRERLRERDEYLDVGSGLDAVDHRIEAIIDSVDRAIEAATGNGDVVEPEVVHRIKQALFQVDELMAEAHDDASPVGATPEMEDADPAAAKDIDDVIHEARQVLAEAAAELQAAIEDQGTFEAQADMARLEGEGLTDPGPSRRPRKGRA